VKIAVQLEPLVEPPARVQYTWDPDTEILSAQLNPRATGDGLSGSVGLEGTDGSWVILDVAAGRINGVEVAVWPDVRKLAELRPPANVQDARVVLPPTRTKSDVASFEMATPMIAEADSTQRNFHFRLGRPRTSRTVRIAHDVLLDLDDKSQIAGLWLLNVPPSPTPS
jgi:hypothetical protein